MTLCKYSSYRATLSDIDFWHHVFSTVEPVEEPPDLDDLDDFDNQYSVCPVCGSNTACGYDSEGRALIHAIEANSNEDL